MNGTRRMTVGFSLSLNHHPINPPLPNGWNYPVRQVGPYVFCAGTIVFFRKIVYFCTMFINSIGHDCW